MSIHHATIEWSHAPEGGSYSRRHAWSFDGGQVIPASASPLCVRPPFSDPAGVDPEEALVAAVSSCHMLWFLDLAKRAGFSPRTYRDAAAGCLGKNAEGREAMISVELAPEVTFEGKDPDDEQLAALHHEAHEHCLIAAWLRCLVEIRAARTRSLG